MLLKMEIIYVLSGVFSPLNAYYINFIRYFEFFIDVRRVRTSNRDARFRYDRWIFGRIATTAQGRTINHPD